MGPKVYVLPQELTIYEVSDIHRELLELFESEQPVQLDASEVEELDTAGFQLLVWFAKLSNHYHVTPPLSALSSVVSNYIKLLNLEEHLLCCSQKVDDPHKLSDEHEC
ncbi:STAS domain-containing protein [Vibrio lamellibrachiae]|uniref:STAS domain-containing protein n=1 Tax=Vibrio lamellibrachiae TaxID=2910253 RepID=UPI003D10D584